MKSALTIMFACALSVSTASYAETATQIQTSSHLQTSGHIQTSSYTQAAGGALTRLQTRWAEVNYQLKDKAQVAAYEELLEEADTFVQQEPNNAELLIWSGIIKSSYAGAKGGLGALQYAKASKADLEKAIAINPKALQGSAYTSLGTLYFKVPGWPIGFGDDDKAEQLLNMALQINPDGIDPNYFYGEYLREHKKYADAVRYYHKAQQAPARPGRELADQGRHSDIEKALTDAEKHLK